ncbi:MAG: DEAD/DEAH box helicase family protein [Akkermansia sp.]
MNKIRLHFEPDLGYQREAIEAVCDLFAGTEKGASAFSVMLPARTAAEQGGTFLENLEFMGSRNSTALSSGEVLRNLQRVQERNGIAKSTELRPNEWHFTVEMETGTGKTYVYLRTILELNKRYGFSKFIIVVPSIAIKEGVNKSMSIMAEHFRTLYDGAELNGFVYDRDKLQDVMNFGTSNSLQVMICTIDAVTDIAAERNRVLYTEREQTLGRKPVEFIRECRPIVIVDEPQKIGEAGEERGIASLHPLCTLRYSATHRNLFHPVYSLNAVDASLQKLVKGIEVASVQADPVHAEPYVKLLGTSRKGGGSAKVELMTRTAGGGLSFCRRDVSPGTLLSIATDCPGVYDDIVVLEVHNDHIRLSNSSEPLRVGESTCRISEEAVTRAMIRVTIEEHARKELRLRPKGIKVLSLFFIDRVEDYRRYDADRNPHPGYLAKVFEEEYTRVMRKPEYCGLFEKEPPAPETVHNGYFSIDKGSKGRADTWEDTSEKNKKGRAAAALAYDLIMRDKEKLLSPEEPLKFIFSHSALREGWDNPNVFQVCVLRDMSSVISRRQTLGRGLRLCVNREGRRVREEGVNILTVVAREDFREFADKLQKEYEADGLRFGVITKERLGTLEYTDEYGERVLLGQEKAEELIDDLRERGLVFGDRPTEELKKQLDADTYRVPEAFQQAQVQIIAKLKSLTRSVEIKDARARTEVTSRYPKMADNAAFCELWERIKQKTVYSISFDTDTLVRKTVDILKRELRKICCPVVTATRTEITVDESGVRAEKQVTEQTEIDTAHVPVGDILTTLEDATHLTRRTLARILRGCGDELQRIRYNGPLFERIVQQVIAAELRKLLVEGVAYHPVRIGETEYNAQEIFRDTEGYLDRLLKTGSKCMADYVEFDSEVERRFAEDAEASSEVKLYVKLPRRFTVPTPLGAYNPDWALVLEADGKNHLYFVVETKSTDLLGELRDKEQGKIACAEKHFDSIAGTHTPPARYLAPVEKLREVIAQAKKP